MTKAERRELDGILLLDKPAGMSSNTALQTVKRLLRARKAGHTGSLDPLATGLLPICLGQATKLSAYLLDADKHYRARARLGTSTTTGDSEGEVNGISDPTTIRRDRLEAAIPRLLGEIDQLPPMYSALKRDGQPLYRLARAGRTVARAPRRIVIHELCLLDFDARRGEFEFEVRCSKGTYVRTLAEDWAAAVGQRAHLVALRRIGLGNFAAQAMVTLEQLSLAAETGEAEHLLLPPAVALAGWPRVQVDAQAARRLAQGQAVAVDGVEASRAIAIFDRHERLLGVAEVTADGRLRPRRWLTLAVAA
ncbi:MAG: tRNA pseudouridine(55) synthase TruB [Sinobacteraceae bacterium]|nr:tRNA pseudouridine(55) synthase TruB [Nevskiaceae bacterium]